MLGKRKVAALVAEFLGTGALTLLVLSVQRSTIGVPFFVAIAAGLTVTLMSFAVGNASGGYFNPAITIGMWTVRKVNTVTAIMYIAFQFLGAWGAYYLYTYLVNSKLQPVGGHFTSRILVAEVVGTLIFGLCFAAAVFKRFSVPVAASVIGLGLMIGIIAASPASLGLLNPAVALGVRAWVWGTYVLGPVIGAVVGINLYALIFADPGSLAFSSVSSSSASSTSVTTSSAVAKPAAKKPAAKRKTTAKKK